jgi:signal recognition particle receptor subunit beta
VALGQGIIFLASLADYCQVLFEDANVNRMHESLNLFGEVTKNPAFEKTPLFVFLNKKDLFEQYIRQKVREGTTQETPRDHMSLAFS